MVFKKMGIPFKQVTSLSLSLLCVCLYCIYHSFCWSECSFWLVVSVACKKLLGIIIQNEMENEWKYELTRQLKLWSYHHLVPIFGWQNIHIFWVNIRFIPAGTSKLHVVAVCNLGWGDNVQQVEHGAFGGGYRDLIGVKGQGVPT